jgi:hypothetical protein
MPVYHACYAFNKTRPRRPPRPARNWKELVTQMHSKPPPAPPRTESTVIHVTDGVNSTAEHGYLRAAGGLHVANASDDGSLPQGSGKSQGEPRAASYAVIGMFPRQGTHAPGLGGVGRPGLTSWLGSGRLGTGYRASC